MKLPSTHDDAFLCGGFRVFLSFLCLILLTGCASHYEAATFVDPYGFFSGIWHGFILGFAILGAILSFLLSLVGISFLEDVTLWGRPNTGFGYWIGYIVGVFVLGGSLGD